MKKRNRKVFSSVLSAFLVCSLTLGNAAVPGTEKQVKAEEIIELEDISPVESSEDNEWDNDILEEDPEESFEVEEEFWEEETGAEEEQKETEWKEESFDEEDFILEEELDLELESESETDGISGQSLFYEEETETETEEIREMAYGEIANPVIVPDDSMTAGQRVTYSCVWFGAYPQAEVVPSISYTGIDSSILRSSDLIIDSSLFNSLQSATGWNSNNDIIFNGNAYRRMKMGDATFSTNGSSVYYKWSDDSSWHYFKYQPVKWRVLSTNGSIALLLADQALDDHRYNETYTSVTWSSSTIRSWMNSTFLNSAFTSGEQSAVRSDTVSSTHILYPDVDGGANTTDKIFLLADRDMYGSSAVSYGFVKSFNTEDEARMSKSSAYAKAMGILSNTNSTYLGNCYWWLRSPGSSLYDEIGVSTYGPVNCANQVDYFSYGFRPALKLNLSSSLYSYAGTVCTNGTINEASGGRTQGGGSNLNSAPSSGSGDSSGTSTHTHTFVTIPAVLPTCTTAGKTAGTKCASCGAVTKSQTTVPALGHSVKKTVTKATTGSAGSIVESCSRCSQTISKTSIPKIGNIMLDASSFVYNGKVQKPAVSVTNASGKALSVSDYKVTYSSGCKAVGTYTVTFDFTGNYAGSVKKTYKIIPKGTTISKAVDSSATSITLSWKKRASQTTGYRIQYGTSSSFKGAKTVTVSGAQTTSHVIKGLKINKNYYFRIRTYKTVSGKKYYSSWSKAVKASIASTGTIKDTVSFKTMTIPTQIYFKTVKNKRVVDVSKEHPCLKPNTAIKQMVESSRAYAKPQTINNTEVFILRPGDKFYPLKFRIKKDITYLYVKNAAGKKGWVIFNTSNLIFSLKV